MLFLSRLLESYLILIVPQWPRTANVILVFGDHLHFGYLMYNYRKNPSQNGAQVAQNRHSLDMFLTLWTIGKGLITKLVKAILISTSHTIIDEKQVKIVAIQPKTAKIPNFEQVRLTKKLSPPTVLVRSGRFLLQIKAWCWPQKRSYHFFKFSLQNEMAVIYVDFGTETQPQIGQGCAKIFSDGPQDVRECRPVKMSRLVTLCVGWFGLEKIARDR